MLETKKDDDVFLAHLKAIEKVLGWLPQSMKKKSAKSIRRYFQTSQPLRTAPMNRGAAEPIYHLARLPNENLELENEINSLPALLVTIALFYLSMF